MTQIGEKFLDELCPYSRTAPPALDIHMEMCRIVYLEHTMKFAEEYVLRSLFKAKKLPHEPLRVPVSRVATSDDICQ